MLDRERPSCKISPMPKLPEQRRQKAARKNHVGKRGDMPHTVAKTYKVSEAVIEAIERVAPMHGSKGRALQVATELLIRMPKPIDVPDALKERPLILKTYKVTPRTVELIDKMVEAYGRQSDVLAACAEILKEE